MIDVLEPIKNHWVNQGLSDTMTLFWGNAYDEQALPYAGLVVVSNVPTGFARGKMFESQNVQIDVFMADADTLVNFIGNPGTPGTVRDAFHFPTFTLASGTQLHFQFVNEFGPFEEERNRWHGAIEYSALIAKER